MPKAPKTTSDAPTAFQEQESERIFRDHLLPRYMQVVHRQGDAIEVSPRAGHAISMVYRTDADGRRAARIVVAPIARKPGK